MAFPTAPSNNDTTIVNGITYIYSSATNSWTRTITPVGNLTITGNVIANKVFTTTGLFWYGNGFPISGGSGGGVTITTDTVPPVSPSVGAQWYDTGSNILFEYLDDGDSQQWVDITSSAISANTRINLTSGDLSVLGDVNPALNNTYDLGNVSYKWRDAYIDGVTTTGNISTTAGVFYSNGAPYTAGRQATSYGMNIIFGI
jgi:hypothetical protein